MKSRLRPGTATTARDQLPSASRYELLVKIASGGMGVVYIGRLRGKTKLLAIKRAHAHLLRDPALRQMLQTEATLASRMNHPNVVGVEGVEELENELLLSMEYVEGAALSDLIAESEILGKRLDTAVIVKIILDACAGLQAVHELSDETLSPLNLVHRDVSPQNILVGVDGVARISDFGIAKGEADDAGSLEGKMGYMAPEYLESKILDARGDIFALGVVAWEALTNQRLFARSNEFETLKRLKEKEVLPPSSVAPELDDRFDNVISTALERDPMRRFQSARAFAEALEATAAEAKLVFSSAEVGERTRALVEPILERRRELVRQRILEIESQDPARLQPPPSFVSPVLPPMPESTAPTSGVRASFGAQLQWIASRPRLAIGVVIVVLAVVVLAITMRPATPQATVSSTKPEPSVPSISPSIVPSITSAAPPARSPAADVDGTAPSAAASTLPSPKTPEKPARSPGKPRTLNRPPGHP